MKRILILILMALGAFAQQTVTLTAVAPSQVQMFQGGVVGTAGTASACYWVVVNYVAGGVLSNPVCLTNVPGTLNTVNYIQLSWQAAQGTSVTYDVLKTTTSAAPVPGASTSLSTGLTTTTATDQGGGLSTYTIAALPYPVGNIVLQLNNRDFAVPSFEYFGQTVQGSLGFVVPKGSGLIRLGNRATPFTIDSTGGTYLLNESATPGAPVGTITAGGLFAASGNLTLAQVNAGAVVVPAVTGQTYKIHHAVLVALGGSTATCTAVEFADTAGTPIVAMSVVAAGLGQNVYASELSAANSTKTTLAPLALTANQGIQVLHTGSNCATATSFNWILFYTINS